MGEKMNIYDISEKAGVSIATVSRVLNGNEKVSEKTRKKVLKVMEETGYKPNAFARGLGLDSMRTVGIMCADSSDSYLANAVYFLEQELRSHQYDVLLCCTGYEQEAREKYAELLISKRVDAVIMVGSNFVSAESKENKYIKKLAEQIPVLLLNGYIKGNNIYSVACNDKEIQYQVTKAFLAADEKAVLYLARRMSYGAKQKIAGFKKACEEARVVVKEEQIIQYNGDVVAVKEMLLKRLKNNQEYRVILCADDELAIGALKYAKEAGRKIPEDLQIVGFNNSVMSLCCEPELTSVDNKLNATCTNAVELLMKVLGGEETESKIIIPAEIINRNTTKIKL